MDRNPLRQETTLDMSRRRAQEDQRNRRDSGGEGRRRPALVLSAWLQPSCRSPAEDRSATAQDDARSVVDPCIPQPQSRRAESESMGPATSSGACLAAFVFPVLLAKQGNVYAPDDDLLAWFQNFGGVHEVPPDDVPTGMVVVGLNSPRSNTTLRLQRLLRRRIEPSVQRQVRELQLRYVGVFVPLVRTEGGECLGAKGADDAAEYVGLLVVELNELADLFLDPRDCPLDVDRFQALRQRGRAGRHLGALMIHH